MVVLVRVQARTSAVSCRVRRTRAIGIAMPSCQSARVISGMAGCTSVITARMVCGFGDGEGGAVGRLVRKVPLARRFTMRRASAGKRDQRAIRVAWAVIGVAVARACSSSA